MPDEIDEPLDTTPEGDAELTADVETTDGEPVGDTADTPAEGQPRDAAGRFAPKAGAQAQTTEGSATDPTVAADAGEPAPTEAAAKPAPAGTPADTPAAPVETPWSFKALGQTWTIPGVHAAADGGIVATREGVELMHRYIGQGIKYEREFPRLRTELERARQERTEQDEHNAIVAAEFARMAQLSDEELVAAVREFRVAYPVLQKEAENRLLKRQLEERTRAAQPDPEQQRAEFVASVRSTFDEAFADVKSQPWAKGLTDDDLSDIRFAVEQAAASFLVTAPRDDVDNGIRKGETLFDDRKFLAFVQRQAGAITRARAANAAAADAAKRNAATMQTTVTAPPAVGGNRTQPPKPKAPAAPAAAESPAEAREKWRKEMGLIA